MLFYIANFLSLPLWSNDDRLSVKYWSKPKNFIIVGWRSFFDLHYVKSVRIRSFSGPFFSYFLVCIFSPNAGKYRPEKLRIRTLFSHWWWLTLPQVTLVYKRDSNTVALLWNLRKFQERLFWKTSANDCYCFYGRCLPAHGQVLILEDRTFHQKHLKLLLHKCLRWAGEEKTSHLSNRTETKRSKTNLYAYLYS